MALLWGISRMATAVTWNISLPKRSNFAAPPSGYNSRPVATLMPPYPRAASIDDRAPRPRRELLSAQAGAGTWQGPPGARSTITAEQAMSNKGQMLQDPFLNT